MGGGVDGEPTCASCGKTLSSAGFLAECLFFHFLLIFTALLCRLFSLALFFSLLGFKAKITVSSWIREAQL